MQGWSLCCDHAPEIRLRGTLHPGTNEVYLKSLGVTLYFNIGKVIFHLLLDVRCHCLVDLYLIALERQHVVAFTIEDDLCNLTLAAGSIDRDHYILV